MMIHLWPLSSIPSAHSYFHPSSPLDCRERKKECVSSHTDIDNGGAGCMRRGGAKGGEGEVAGGGTDGKSSVQSFRGTMKMKIVKLSPLFSMYTASNECLKFFQISINFIYLLAELIFSFSSF